MLTTLLAASLAFGALKVSSAQAVTCTNYGLAACPYPQATTADLQALIAEYCGYTGDYPWYKYSEDLEAQLPEGYYQVTSDFPGRFSQETCSTSLNNIVSQCDATGGFWLFGEYVTDGITFSITTCELA